MHRKNPITETDGEQSQEINREKKDYRSRGQEKNNLIIMVSKKM